MNDLVARAKFEREVDRIKTYIAAQRPGYRWRLLKTERPRIVLEMEHPGHVPLVMRVWATDWDQRAASFLFVDGEDTAHNTMLPAARWPGAPFQDHHAGPFRDDHRRVGRKEAEKAAGRRPFICLRGTREFHEDQRHQNEPWDSFRGKDNNSILAMLISIQEKIHDVCRSQVVQEARHG